MFIDNKMPKCAKNDEMNLFVGFFFLFFCSILSMNNTQKVVLTVVKLNM